VKSGNLKSRSDSNESYTERFCYDALNRLTSYNIGSLCTGGKTVSYDSGGIGNIATKSDAGTYSYPAAGSPLPHAVSSIAGTVDGLTNPQYAYDGDGNLSCISTGSGCTGTVGKQVSVTGFNMAATITQGTTTVSFTYDSEHKRISQSSTVSGSTTTTTYLNDPASGAMEEKVVSGGATTWRDYLTADGAIIGVRSVTGGPHWGSAIWGSFNWGPTTKTVTYFVLDHLGSVAVVTNNSGFVTQRFSYDAWGKERNPNGSDLACGAISRSTTRGYTNQEQLDQVCLIDLNARIYDPAIGKFHSADPVVGNVFIPNAFNRYAYVLNNPLILHRSIGPLLPRLLLDFADIRSRR
jgi:RHS repeat-associated protein